MKAWAWRREGEGSYCVQIENIKGKRKLNKVLKLLSDWKIISDGYNAKTEEYTYIFAKNFANTNKWLTWAESFPVYLTETTSHGNEKIRNKKLIKKGTLL
jgi:hypothetical protein|tara:strand:- start:670 stop:969 length:300 start_codon:yes stop_codon:yes gene_type:complete